ncbi:MAG: hypothetical protein NW237_14485 [Cyanobacteriota bacterium]|nr:hypothetical protein [Cyanobacteriota bacterium]
MVELFMLGLTEDSHPPWPMAEMLMIFFGLSAPAQQAMLPKLAIAQKFDFPEGDLLSANALEILLNSYKACLNTIAIHFLIQMDELEKQGQQDALLLELTDIVDQTLYEISQREGSFALEEDAHQSTSSLDHPAWDPLRKWSLTLKNHLHLEREITPPMVKSCLTYWLHP